MGMDAYIREKIEEALKPIHFELVNESHKHAGHMGDDGSGETHYKLIVVSDSFEGLSRIDRQRQVNSVLCDAFGRGLHALALRLFSPAEFHGK